MSGAGEAAGGGANGGRPLPPRRAQLHQPRIGEIVARSLRERILEGKLADGAALPRQEDLMAEFGVSRPSLREALRELETEGLISIRRGNVGGAVVRLPSATSVAYMLGLALQTERTAIADVSDALLHLEPLCAGLCAERADRAQSVVPALQAVHDEMVAAIDGDEHDFTVAASRFHEALVQNCGNASLIWVVGALETIWSAHAEEVAVGRTEEIAVGGTATVPEMDRRAGIRAHGRIIELVAAGDARETSALVRRHLEYGQRVPLAAGAQRSVTAGLIREPGLAQSMDHRLDRPASLRPAHRR